MNARLIRELVDSRVRPAQPGGTLSVDRTPSGAMLRVSRPAALNRYDWASGTNVVGALYARTRYGSARYTAVN